jgi:CBS domain-containing protein
MLDHLVSEFLSQFPPFDSLSPKQLSELSASARLTYYPANSALPMDMTRPDSCLHVIQKGSVRLMSDLGDGQTLPLDMRGSGEVLYFSPMGTNKVLPLALADEDTLCYLIPIALVQQIRQQNPQFDAFFKRGAPQRYLERSLREIQSAVFRNGGNSNERRLFTTTIRNLIKRALVHCTPDVTIRQAATMMRDAKVSSMVVCTDLSHIKTAGIVTNDDFRSRVIAVGKSTNDPIVDVMSSPIQTIRADALVFEAMLKMMNLGINFLPVVDDVADTSESPNPTTQKKLIGMVNGHDLMLLQGSSPVLVANDIAKKSNPGALASALQRSQQFIPLMVQEGAHPSSINRVVAEINDRVMLRLIDITEKKLGPPPLPYCWVVMGSEGRREQTFKTDQDNGLIYANPIHDSQAEQAEQYFTAFAEHMYESLIACGVPACPGNYMARNPSWRKSLLDWQRTFYRWIATPEPQEVMNATIFFDMRPSGGASSLCTQLFAEVRQYVARNNRFRSHLARLAIQNTPPLGFFRGFLVENSGPHKNEFDIKKRGVMPITDLVRVLALEHGIEETNSLDRIAALAKAEQLAQDDATELRDTLEFLMLLRLRHQADLIQQGKPPDNFINPEALGYLERISLREAFEVIARWQDVLRSDYFVDKLG